MTTDSDMYAGRQLRHAETKHDSQAIRLEMEAICKIGLQVAKYRKEHPGSLYEYFKLVDGLVPHLNTVTNGSVTDREISFECGLCSAHLENITDTKLIDELEICVCPKCYSKIIKYKKKHPGSLSTYSKLISWYEGIIAHETAVKSKTAQNRLLKRRATRVIAKHDYPPAKPIKRTSFRTFSSGEYKQDIKNPADAYRTVSGSESLRPVPCAKNQVSIR